MGNIQGRIGDFRRQKMSWPVAVPAGEKSKSLDEPTCTEVARPFVRCASGPAALERMHEGEDVSPIELGYYNDLPMAQGVPITPELVAELPRIECVPITLHLSAWLDALEIPVGEKEMVECLKSFQATASAEQARRVDAPVTESCYSVPPSYDDDLTKTQLQQEQRRCYEAEQPLYVSIDIEHMQLECNCAY